MPLVSTAARQGREFHKCMIALYSSILWSGANESVVSSRGTWPGNTYTPGCECFLGLLCNGSQALLVALTTYCPSWESANNAQKRLLKRPANFFAGWLGRNIRMPSQRLFYADLHIMYTELARIPDAAALASGVRDVFGMYGMHGLP